MPNSRAMIVLASPDLSRGMKCCRLCQASPSASNNFQVGQSQTKPAATSQTWTSQISAGQTSAATPPTGSAPSGGANPPPPSGSGSAANTTESASTRNADGTYGPRHTLQSPLSYTLLHSSAQASSSVDIKA